MDLITTIPLRSVVDDLLSNDVAGGEAGSSHRMKATARVSTKEYRMYAQCTTQQRARCTLV
jgi:hypothetical protein